MIFHIYSTSSVCPLHRAQLTPRLTSAHLMISVVAFLTLLFSACLHGQVIIDDSFDEVDLGTNPNGIGAGFNSDDFGGGGAASEAGGEAEVAGGPGGASRTQIASKDVFSANSQFTATATFSIESFGRSTTANSDTTRLFVGMVNSASTSGDGINSTGVLANALNGLWVALQSREDTNGFDNGVAGLVYVEGNTVTTLATWTWDQSLVDWDDSSTFRSDRISTQLLDPITLTLSSDAEGYSLSFATTGEGTLPPNVSGTWLETGLTNDLSAVHAAAYLQGNLGDGSHMRFSSIEAEVATATSVVLTSSTDAALATGSVSDDLLQTSLSSTNWPSNNAINNGSTGSFNEDSVTNPASATSEGTYDFNLDLSASPGGYAISQINSFSGWMDDRAGQRYTVFFSFVGDSSFTEIGTTVDVTASGDSLVTNLFRANGDFLGCGVDVVRFVVEANGLTNVWREIDVIGEPSLLGIVNFTVSPEITFPGEAVTLDWEVGMGVTTVLIDQGIGDVTSLTNANGVGTLTLDPGPSFTTAYTLSASLPTFVSEESRLVTVTEEPVISLFNVDEAFPSPGSTVNLTWNAQNLTSLLLDGVDVTGQTGQAVTPPLGQTSYVLTAENENGIIERTLTVFSLAEGGVIISEFVASNSTLADEDGELSDWIEIYNPTSTAANLAGYSLTDDASLLTQWVFPAVTLLPGEYLVVFASGKNRAAAGSELHTNFGLSRTGEYLALIEPDGLSIATEFSPEYPEPRGEYSYGYDSSELGFRYFFSPSPGAINGDSFMGFVGDTNFSVNRGFFETAFPLEITSNTVGATIRYTIDGTEPDQMSGLIYGPGPIMINGTTVVRAAAFMDDFMPTNIDTQSYIFPADVVTQPDMRPEITGDSIYGPQVIGSLTTVPTISLSFDGSDIDRNEAPVSVELMNFESAPTQLNAGAVRFGSFVTNFEKRSFRLHFRSRYGAPRLDYPLFADRDYEVPPVETFDSLDIRAGNHDMNQRGAYLGNRFADDLTLDMGHVAPHGRFANVYFNGQYRGMYHLRERWDTAMLSDYLPGEEEEFDSINGNNANRIDFLTGDLDGGDLVDWDEIQSRLVSEPRFEQVRDMLDLNNYIDFMTLFTWGTCEAEFRAGGSVSNGVGFRFFLKDADGFFQPRVGPGNPPPGGSFAADNAGPLNAMRLLMAEDHPDFRTLLADRIHRQMFNDGAMTPGELTSTYTSRLDEARLPYFSEIARWGSHVGRANRNPEAWEAYHQDLLANQIPIRTAERIALYEQAGMYPATAAPVYSQHGGSLDANGLLTLSVPSTVSRIHYISGPADTDPDIYVNSLDPRLSGGALSGVATTIDFSALTSGVDFIETGDTSSVQIALSEAGWLLARSFDEATGEWSALNEAFFTLATVPADSSNLVVSKIHYNPADPTGAELAVSDDSDDFEFIELLNVGSQTIDLTGVSISGGIAFDFGDFNQLGAGERFVIPRDQTAFEARYSSLAGGVIHPTDIFGETEFQGGLSNGGEELMITDALGLTIQQFTYDDKLPWPTVPDGLGYALVLINPSTPIPDHTIGSNWAASALIGGSPGSGSEVGFVGDPDADLDGNGLSAFAEYAFGSSSPAILGSLSEFFVAGVSQTYLTISFPRNQHAVNTFDFTVQVSSDLENWEGLPNVTLVSDVDNGDGTSTTTYRSVIPVGEAPQNREFIRVVVSGSL